MKNTREMSLLDADTIKRLKSVEKTPLQIGDTVVPEQNFNYKMEVVKIATDGSLIVNVQGRNFPWNHPYRKLHAA